MRGRGGSATGQIAGHGETGGGWGMAGKRAIFEETGAATARGAAGDSVGSSVGSIDRGRGARRGVRLWLVFLGLLVVAMILVGGLTRLTDSGLSITEWKPVSGALPPMSADHWQAEFDAYRATPQFRNMNNAMTLDEFKFIFWWEWGHRQLGRLIGLVWAVGFFGFLLARRMPPGWTGRLFGVGVLIGVQGAIGWWMVASGLVGEMTRVASYRLAAHLGLAFALFGLITSYAVQLGRSEGALMKARRLGERRLFTLAGMCTALIFVQILLGALVAGIDAGRGYTDWPWMAGEFLPPDMLRIAPWWRNFFENDGTVQFTHRMAGYLVLAGVLWAWLAARRSPFRATRRAFALAAGMVLVQVVLGIVTVMHSAPLSLAILHQGGAILTLWLMLRARQLARAPVGGSLREA